MRTMVLVKRIIPCLDVKDGKVVKGISFRNLRDIGNPVELARIYRDQGADEIVFLDITATIRKRHIIRDLVRSVASTLDIPFTVGGGINGIEDVSDVLNNGADKVSINTAAIMRPELIKEVSEVYGSQCVVIAIDAKRIKVGEKTIFKVFSQSGKVETDREISDWAIKAEKLGAGELLVTSIDNDGTKKGYDIEMLKKVTGAVRIPVIASGGCGSLEHFLDVFKYTSCDAALAASVFHDNELTINQVKEYLSKNGVTVRL